jgi:CheY-like chemotaxis protein
VSGYDVGRALRDEQASEGMCLIALSGYADSASKKRAADAGFETHLAKPPDIGVLEQMLVAVAKGRRRTAASEA